jgi:hypothetical protein
MQTEQCVRTTIWIMIRMLSLAVATVTRQTLLSACRVSFSSTSSQFRSMRFEQVVIGNFLKSENFKLFFDFYYLTFFMINIMFLGRCLIRVSLTKF